MELTVTQQNVINSLATGVTITAAAEAHNLHRVTIYRWMKSNRAFSESLRQLRAEFVLARRDDLHTLTNRALDALAAIFDDPKASPSVRLKAAMFILTRPQLPKTGWSMAEPLPNPDSDKLLDSAMLEQDYASLPCLASIERDPEPAEATECNEMQHDSVTDPAEATLGVEATECNEMQHVSVTIPPAPTPQPPTPPSQARPKNPAPSTQNPAPLTVPRAPSPRHDSAPTP